MELCDIQNEENKKRGIAPPPKNAPYEMGKGPNPNFHDDGLRPIKRLIKIEDPK